MTCIVCNEEKPARDFGRQPKRANGLDPRCKVCINEQAKRSIRLNQQLPRFASLIETWPVEHLASELEWLEIKAQMVEAEIRSRARPPRARGR